MKQSFSYLLLALLAGCAATQEIVSTGNDTYRITRNFSDISRDKQSPRIYAVRTAYEYCKRTGKGFQVVNLKESQPPYTSSQPRRIILDFKCRQELTTQPGLN